MYLTLGQAAKETGKSKATISNYIANGKLSCVSKDKSGYQIDPAELFRVFNTNKKINERYEQSIPPLNTPEHNEIKLRLELALREIETLKSDKEDLKSERNDWKDQAQKLLLNPPEKPTQRQKGLFGMFRTTKG